MRNNTYYCTTDCQKTSWKNGHKEICKLLGAIRTLYRAGSILQQIFYKYRERVFDRRIVKIEEKNGKLYLHEQRPPQMDFEMLRLLDFLVPFPTHLCRTKQDRQSIASYLACNDALAWMHDVIKDLLEGWLTFEMGAFTMTDY
jgi:hypothetical protein